MEFGEYDCLVKIVHVGDTGVGKTNLLFTFCEESHGARLTSTIGVDFKIKTIEVDQSRVKLQLWDTAGQEKFKSLTKAYYRLADAFVLCYDVTRPSTFERVPGW